MYYRGRYVQKGYGLGGIFRSVSKIFNPIARKIATVVRQPEVRKVLKTLGKSAADTGSELLISKLKGESVQPKLKEKIASSKKQIVESIKEGISELQRKRSNNQYNHLSEDLSDSDIQSNYKKNGRSTAPSFHRNPSNPYKRLVEDISDDESPTNFKQTRRSKTYSFPTKPKPRRPRRSIKYRSVFD